MSGAEQQVPAAVAMDLAAQRVEAETGLHFAGSKRRQFDAALGKMAEALGHASADECAGWLIAGPWDEQRSAQCARFLTVGETYFFREPRALDLVCEQAQARLGRCDARPLRIWSAGCCTGEEPYSIVMALRRRVPRLAPGMVSILATDLNDAFLDFARAGVYRRWSFRRTEAADQAAFFRPLDDGRFEIDASLRGQISFAHLNLAANGYPSAANGTLAMDVIFCRNVLMYFGRAQVKRVIARLRDCLVDDGWLVVNASEASSELFEGFTPVCHEDAVFFRKRAARAPAAAGGAPAMPAHRKAAVPVPRARASASRAPVPAPVAGAGQPAQAEGDAIARARVLLAAGSRGEAMQCLRRAAESEPFSAAVHCSVALFALEQGERALARQSVRQLLYLDPDSAIGHYAAALIEDAEGRRAQSLRLLQACRRLAGSDDELYAAAGQWLERMQ